MERTLLAAASATALLAGAAAAATPGQWRVDYGMGTAEARVENERGAAFDVYCPTGEDDDSGRGVLFHAGVLPLEPEADRSYPALLRIDDAELPWRLTYIGGREFQSVAFDARTAAGLDGLLDRLHGGAALAVAIPALGVEERFTLRGAAAALDGMAEACAPP